jgi:hypothetical protein
VQGIQGPQGPQGPAGPTGPQGAAGAGALYLDDSVGSPIARYAGFWLMGSNNLLGMGLIFSQHDVPVLYWASNSVSTNATLSIPPLPLQFTTTDCSGIGRFNPFTIQSWGGLGAFNLAFQNGSSNRLFRFNGLQDSGSVTIQSKLESGTCAPHSATVSSHLQMQEITGLPAVPNSIPFGYRISSI